MPSQNATVGKASLGRITKRGDDSLRALLIQGAKSAGINAGKLSDRISQWLAKLKDRVGWRKAVVALANKNARILWAVLGPPSCRPWTTASGRNAQVASTVESGQP